MLCLFSYWPKKLNKKLSSKLWIYVSNLSWDESFNIKQILDDSIWFNYLDTSRFIKFISKELDNKKLKKYLSYVLSSTKLLTIDVFWIIDTENYNKALIREIYSNMIISWNSLKLTELGYLWFKNIQTQIEKILFSIDTNYDKLDLNKIEFIWDILTTFYSSDNKSMKFVNLVSIIEYLLVNWNDNISQQFIFKTMIVYEKATGIYLKSELLKNIYHIRSLIVHWRENNSTLENEDFNMNYLELLNIVSKILNFYILNPSYINYIKDTLWKKP